MILNKSKLDILLKEVCEEKNVNIEFLSYDYIIKLSKNNVIKYVYGRQFDHNTSVFNKIARDKYALYEVLKSNNIEIIEHRMLFNPKTREEYMTQEILEKTIEDYIHSHGNEIVLKANEGSSGTEVFRVHNLKEAKECTDLIFQTSNNAVMCPFYKIKNEYRVIFLDGECKLIFSKQRPSIIGDGFHTVKELFNKKKEEFSEFLTDEKLEYVDFNYVPQIGEEIVLSWKHNLCNGAMPEIVENEELIRRLKELSKRVNDVLKIFFASIDIIELEDGSLQIIEINSNVCLSKFATVVPNGDNIIKNIYREVIDKYFN